MFQMPQKRKMPNTSMRRVSLGSYFLRILFLVQLSPWGERLSQRGLRQRQEGHCVLSLSHRSHRPTSGREETIPLFLPSAAGHRGQEAGGLQRLRDAAGGTTTHSDVLEVRTQLFFSSVIVLIEHIYGSDNLIHIFNIWWSSYFYLLQLCKLKPFNI